MAKEFDSVTSRSERTITEMIVSFIEEDKQEIVEKDLDSVSSESYIGVLMNIKDSFGCEGGRITVIDDSAVKEKQEIVEKESDFISGCENSTVVFSDIKEKQEMAGIVMKSSPEESFKTFSVIEAENKVELLSEAQDSATEALRVEPFFADGKKRLDSSSSSRITVIDDSTVKEKQEIVEKESDFISGCENSTVVFSDIKEKQEMTGIVMKSSPEESFKTFSAIEAENKVELLSEAQDSATEVLQAEPVFADGKKRLDSSSGVEEKKETVDDVLESQSQNPVEMMSRLRRLEESSDHFLKINGKTNVMEPELGSVLEAQNHGVKMIGVENPGESTGDSPEIKEILEVFSDISEKQGMVEIEAQNADGKLNSWDGFASCTSEVKEMQEMVENDGEKMNQNYCGKKERGSMALGKKSSGSSLDNIKQDMAGKKENCSRRRAKGKKKVSETNGKQNMSSLLAGARNVCQKRGDGSKRSYSRNELEALRFVNGEEQQKIWNGIYHGLGPVVARELDDMSISKAQKQGRKNTDHRQRFGKNKENAPVLGVVAAKGRLRKLPADICAVRNG